MQKIYLLEVYHFDHDYWTTIGAFLTKEAALEEKERIEAKDMLFCSIFEKNLQSLFSIS